MRPPESTTKLGMLLTLKRPASCGYFSVSTFSTTALPAMSAAVRATSGAAATHGLHHPAQKSTSTGTGLLCTTSSNNCSSAARGSAMGGSGDLQEPQRPVLARNLAGIRFCVLQWLHVRMTGKREPSVHKCKTDSHIGCHGAGQSSAGISQRQPGAREPLPHGSQRPCFWVMGQFPVTRRNIKGAPFGVGFECLAQHLQK